MALTLIVHKTAARQKGEKTAFRRHLDGLAAGLAWFSSGARLTLRQARSKVHGLRLSGPATGGTHCS